MKKMKLQMLGLSVNDLLSREQMKKVMGGSGSGSGGSGDQSLCSITTQAPGGNGSYISYVAYDSSTPCATQSQNASVAAASQQQQQYGGGGTTHYDCGCDGWGH